MAEDGEDIRSASIADVASADMDGSDTLNEVNVEAQNLTYTNDTTTDVETWFADTDAIDTMRIGAAI